MSNLESLQYVDKTRGAKVFTEASNDIAITEETDRVYQNINPEAPVVVNQNGKPYFAVKPEALNCVVVWNPWVDKAAGMADFGPKDGYKNMSEY